MTRRKKKQTENDGTAPQRGPEARFEGGHVVMRNNWIQGDIEFATTAHTWMGWWTNVPPLCHSQSVGGNCVKCWESWPCREVRRLTI